MEMTTTNRGYSILKFDDRNGEACSLQESSLADEAAIWLGASDLKIKRFPANGTGWHDVDLGALFPGQDVIGNERMHLTRKQVKALLPYLKHFAKHGCLPNDKEA